MEKLEIRTSDAIRALKTLEDILKEPFSVIVRDAAIQRFEYTFESVWKCLREHLLEEEGLRCNSPKSCFRELLAQGYLGEDEVVELLEMVDSRNATSHTYREETSDAIYARIPAYFEAMSKALKAVRRPARPKKSS